MGPRPSSRLSHGERAGPHVVGQRNKPAVTQNELYELPVFLH